MNEKARDKKETRSIKHWIFYNKCGERTLLGRFFFDKEKNLKEVPVGIAAVLAVIILISLVVQVKEPAKETVVKVTHLFKSAPPKGQKAEVAETSKEEKQAEKERETKEKTKEEGKVADAEKKEVDEDLKTKREEIKQFKKGAAKKEEEEENKIIKETANKSNEIKEKAVDVKGKNETVKNKAIKYDKSADNVKEKSKEVKSHPTPIADVSKWPDTKEKMASLKISDEEYARLYRARFANGAKEPEIRYRWRVSNQYRLKLKDCYTLFDMKAIAVTEDGRYYDLSDHSQLTEDYLNENYSSTIILCENPGVDFGDHIKELGLKAEGITVQYYMYNHIRNYFYNRVAQAVGCCLEQGKISKEKNWQERIDVVGNVYKIKKASGGFGVFVPTSVYYRRLNSSTEEEIRVSPSCFENEKDVGALKAKHLL